uniref:AlNc14C43G3555 protein n=1 Tax=Albugo laibachii Nc14 TaxID=890382 RepID=F0WA11_9STRA|nr:AlNc14C43G3555 [Albugo laibachii Nc14]CCA27726.1 AlNc14C656G12342 [Albugo laibachii Nc14]|eukprot:CCA27726.1 AlNc14C656G12342 [Albugo laibachii Nc14]
MLREAENSPEVAPSSPSSANCIAGTMVNIESIASGIPVNVWKEKYIISLRIAPTYSISKFRIKSTEAANKNPQSAKRRHDLFIHQTRQASITAKFTIIRPAIPYTSAERSSFTKFLITPDVLEN